MSKPHTPSAVPALLVLSVVAAPGAWAAGTGKPAFILLKMRPPRASSAIITEDFRPWAISRVSTADWTLYHKCPGIRISELWMDYSAWGTCNLT